MSTICHSGQSGKVINLLTWCCIPLGHQWVSNSAYIVVQISQSKQKSSEWQASLRAAFSPFLSLKLILTGQITASFSPFGQINWEFLPSNRYQFPILFIIRGLLYLNIGSCQCRNKQIITFTMQTMVEVRQCPPFTLINSVFVPSFQDVKQCPVPGHHTWAIVSEYFAIIAIGRG